MKNIDNIVEELYTGSYNKHPQGKELLKLDLEEIFLEYEIEIRNLKIEIDEYESSIDDLHNKYLALSESGSEYCED